MKINCPKCDADISDTFEEGDWSTGVSAGWYCEACDLGIGEGEVERESFPDDVPISTDREVHGDRPLGTPISQLSGRPGEKGYAEFCRIARSWGHP